VQVEVYFFNQKQLQLEPSNIYNTASLLESEDGLNKYLSRFVIDI
jgi:hypothetical protein